jgi:hypothetical protein
MVSTKGVKAAGAAAEIAVDDSMLSGITSKFAPEREGKFRASAVIVENGAKICMISCDILLIKRDILDEVCKGIEDEFGIPFENILITATHTHHALRDETFHENLKRAILSAVRTAEEKLKDAGEAEMYFWLGNESTVGQNSRLLLSDNTVYWAGSREDALRPTGPFDPDLPVIAFKRGDGTMEALLFNHSTHNIGTKTRKGGVHSRGVYSPDFYGLVAQELEEELGGTVLFLPGAFGSNHNLVLPGDEMVLRIKNAIREALSESKTRVASNMASVKYEFEYRVRKFDEGKEDEAVSYYCNSRFFAPSPMIEEFRRLRRELSGHQGEVRRSWLHVMLLGDVALVGVPGELFTRLGIQIKRRSPFRYTYVIGLANDWIGYIPDKEAYNLGGYQVWTGYGFVEKGTGETIVEKATQLLSDLHSRYCI